MSSDGRRQKRSGSVRRGPVDHHKPYALVHLSQTEPHRDVLRQPLTWQPPIVGSVSNPPFLEVIPSENQAPQFIVCFSTENITGASFNFDS
jgi:hypothetical protein